MKKKEMKRMNNKNSKIQEKKVFGIPWNAFIFGFVSFLNDFSSELTIRALPPFFEKCSEHKNIYYRAYRRSGRLNRNNFKNLFRVSF